MPSAELPGAAQFIPKRASLSELREAVQGCRGCPLYRNATQAVFGEGPERARIVLIGEQPGDQEDRQGRPFVGPAGKILDRALVAAGIARRIAYVTNAVKHFSFEPRGKARLHKRPRPGEIRACRSWLDAELSALKPEGVVLLGATAAQSLLGPSFRVTRERGRPLESDIAPLVIATIHPSSVLREPDSKAREHAFEGLVSDLRIVATHLQGR
ncbi:MAG TPA: UdgX family uracil-DNA binding protein [Polyangiaceae bacterium]